MGIASRFREALSLFLEWCERSVELAPVSQLLAAHSALRLGEFQLAGTLAAAVQPELYAIGDQDCLLDCAEIQFRSVLQMAEGAGCARFIARSANNLAVIAHMRGHPRHAAALYQKALTAYHQIEDQRGIIETRYNLALSRRETGRAAATLSACTRVVDAAERFGAGGLIALTLLGRAELLIECDALEQAAADIDRARLLAWLEGNEPHVLESERLQALLALRRGQPAHAYRHAELVRSRASHSGCALIAAESAALAALALKADRRLPEAAVANDLAVASLVALGATARLENHARAWRGTAA